MKRSFASAARFSVPRGAWALFLAMLTALVTGCPANYYTVELKPKGETIERTLAFYNADGANSNGIPNYGAFPTNELGAITRVYPAGAVRPDGARYIATGEFAGQLPNDVGGAGSYTNFTTGLGQAGFYVERFRGNDDLAGGMEKRFHAADQITDLVIGWSQKEFGREHGFKKLRKFLDENFRKDLKNAGCYAWTGEVGALSDANALEEFAVRFGQFLHERGCLKLSDMPELSLILEDGNDNAAILHWIQRLAADKMGIPASRPLPKSFAVLDDTNAFQKSWERYLAGSGLYRAQVKEWERKRKTDPKLAPPKPLDAADDLVTELLFDFQGGEADHLTVKLALNRAPAHTNGKWHDGQVVWTADLDANRPLPAFCYASWSTPDVKFQTDHFGGVILDGDELSQYCLWQAALGGEQAQEWESFLARAHPGPELKAKIENFRFVAEAKGEQNPLATGRKLLLDAFGNAKTVNAGSK